MRREWGRVAACAAIALGLHLAYQSAVRGTLVVEADQIGYDQLGWRLAQGEGFPADGADQPKRPPLYPMLLAAIYRAADHRPQAVRLLQACLAASFPLLVYLIAVELRRRRVISQGAPVAAAALASLYPPFVFYAALLYRETLITWLLLASLWPLVRYAGGGGWRNAVGFGIGIGLTALTDDRFLYFPLVAGALLWWWDRRSVRWLRFGLLSLLAAAAVIGPWTIRNYMTFHRLIPVAVAQEKGFWLATHPGEFLEWDWGREPLKSYAALDPSTRHQVLAHEAWENLRRHPFIYVKLCAKRFVRLWAGGHSNAVPLMRRSLVASVREKFYGIALLKAACAAVNLFYLVGGALGALWLLRARWHPMVIALLTVILYVAVVHTLVFASPRYHLPVIPVFILFFAAAVRGRQPSAATAERSVPWPAPAMVEVGR